jgi:outer membrane protein
MIASLKAVSLVCLPVAVVLLVSCVGLSLDAGAQPAAPAQPPKAAAQPPAPVPPAPAAAPPLTQPIKPQIQETPLPPPIELPPPPAPAVPPDVPNRPLSADEAALIALHHQPTVIEASAGISAARGRTQQARSGLLPLLAVTAGYSHVETLATETTGAPSGVGGGTVTTGGGGVTVAGYQAAGTLRQLLFDFNHTRDLVRESAALERLAAANLTRVQSDLVLQVKQAFYTYVQDQALVTVNETNLRDQQAHLALAQARLKSGLGLPSDVVRAETAVADAMLNLNVAQNNASVARVNLALFLGIDPRTPLQAAGTGEPPNPSNDVAALVQTALTQRPDIRQFQENLRATQYAVGAAKTTNTPALSATISASTRGANFPPGNDFLTIGANIVWDPFDGGLTAGRVREARANRETAQAQLTGTQLAVTSDVSQAYINLRTAEQRVTTADAEVANAQESVRLADGRYRAGVGTFIDVTDAQAALLTAQTNRVNAQSAVDQARAALAHAIGAPLPTPPR